MSGNMIGTNFKKIDFFVFFLTLFVIFRLSRLCDFAPGVESGGPRESKS